MLGANRGAFGSVLTVVPQFHLAPSPERDIPIRASGATFQSVPAMRAEILNAAFPRSAPRVATAPAEVASRCGTCVNGRRRVFYE